MYVLYMIAITGFSEIIAVSDDYKKLSRKIDDVCSKRHFTMIDDWIFITQFGTKGSFYIEKAEVI